MVAGGGGGTVASALLLVRIGPRQQQAAHSAQPTRGRMRGSEALLLAVVLVYEDCSTAVQPLPLLYTIAILPYSLVCLLVVAVVLPAALGSSTTRYCSYYAATNHCLVLLVAQLVRPRGALAGWAGRLLVGD